MRRGISLFNRPLNFQRAPHIRSLPLLQYRFFLHGHVFHCDCRIFRSLNTL
jgi:hypothetical protein